MAVIDVHSFGFAYPGAFDAAEAVDAAEQFSKQIASIERGHMWAVGVGWSGFPEHCAPVKCSPHLSWRVHVSGPISAKRRLRLVVLNDSQPVVTLLCDWFTQHGHHCDAALLSDMPRAHEDVWRFISAHRPDVVVYDVGMPYESSWDLLEAIRMSPALQSQSFVITTPNKAKLEEAVGRTDALEISGRERDLRRLLKAVDEATDVAREGG